MAGRGSGLWPEGCIVSVAMGEAEVCGTWGACSVPSSASSFLPVGGPGHPIKAQVGLLQSLRKSRPLLGSLPAPTKVQNRNTIRPAPGLGCFWVLREGAAASPPSPLFTTIYFDSLDQTPNAPTWPDFIKLSPPPREAGPNDDEKNPIFCKGLWWGMGLSRSQVQKIKRTGMSLQAGFSLHPPTPPPCLQA